jgi:hypothetical protein
LIAANEEMRPSPSLCLAFVFIYAMMKKMQFLASGCIRVAEIAESPPAESGNGNLNVLCKFFFSFQARSAGVRERTIRYMIAFVTRCLSFEIFIIAFKRTLLSGYC